MPTGTILCTAVAAGAFIGAQGAWAECARPDICRRAISAAEEVRQEFLQAKWADVYRLIDVHTEGALVVAEFEVQAIWEDPTESQLAKIRSYREASRVSYFCEENVEARRLIEVGVDFRVRHVSKNGVVLNDVTITECEQK